MSNQARAPRPPADLPNVVQASSPRLALRKPEAAAALGVSDETFDRHVRPSLPVVRLGSTRVYPVALLERWLLENASAPLDELEARR